MIREILKPQPPHYRIATALQKRSQACGGKSLKTSLAFCQSRGIYFIASYACGEWLAQRPRTAAEIRRIHDFGVARCGGFPVCCGLLSSRGFWGCGGNQVGTTFGLTISCGFESGKRIRCFIISKLEKVKRLISGKRVSEVVSYDQTGTSANVDVVVLPAGFRIVREHNEGGNLRCGVMSVFYGDKWIGMVSTWIESSTGFEYYHR
ncbi:MAG: hypothetical protein ACP5I8_09770 [Phycisphaerae bacterium]